MPQPFPFSQRRTFGRPMPSGRRGPAAETAERISGVYVDLRLGSSITLRPLIEERTYEAEVVGLKPYEYFMVQARLPQETLARLQTSPALAARLNLGGMEHLFYTSMLSRVAAPAPVLFLAYPETLQRLALRRSRRLRVSIPCTVQGPFGEHEGLMVDMDATGCRCNVRTSLSSPLRTIQPGEFVVLNYSLLPPEPPLNTLLQLSRVEEGHGRISLGGRFKGLNGDSLRQVEDYMRRMETLSGEG